jgi:phosphoenolpyruvate carboxykinase (ATP)
MSTMSTLVPGLTVSNIHHNLSPSALYEHAIRFEKDASIAENGALVAYSGVKTGRSPKDKRVVENPASKNDIWWSSVNIPCDQRTFDINRQRALDYLNTRDQLYCFDGFAGWDPKYRIKVRVICSRPCHALFMHTMLIRPPKEELANYGAPDFVIMNAGAFPANRLTNGMGSTTSIDLSLEDRQLVLLQKRFASGDLNQRTLVSSNGIDNLRQRSFLAFVKRVFGIAVGATQIAKCQPNEYAWPARPGALALDGVIDFVNR